MMQSGVIACRVHVALQQVLCSTFNWQCLVVTGCLMTQDCLSCVEKRLPCA